MIVINLKNYKIGPEILDLVKKIEIYHNKSIVAIPTLNISQVVNNTNLQVYAQHVDSNEPGRGTGFTIPESLIGLGVQGSLLNHSEHKIKITEIKKTLKRCNELGLKLIVCAASLREAQQLKKLNPYAIAYEDKKLIATGKSITSYEAEDVRKFVEILRDTNIIPLCGAGITSGEDVAKALVLGCKGVLVSSAVANSQNPEKFLKEVSSML